MPAVTLKEYIEIMGFTHAWPDPKQPGNFTLGTIDACEKCHSRVQGSNSGIVSMNVLGRTFELVGLTVRYKTAPDPELTWSNILGMEVCGPCFEQAGG